MEQLPFQALFEHSSIGIIISRLDGDIEQSNPYASKIFGYDKDELNGQNIEVLIPPQLKEKHILYRQSYNSDPQPRTMGSNLNLLAVKKNGEQFPVEISLSYFDIEGFRRIVCFVNDITSRKQSEYELKNLTEELESKVAARTRELSDALSALNQTNEQIRSTLEKEKELSELKSRFVSMASHEFRTPLSRIMTSVSLIASYRSQEDEGKREKHIQTIKKSVKNLTVILNDFLSLDKLNQGKVTSHPNKFLLVELIDEIVDEFKSLSEKDHIFTVNNENPEAELFQDSEMLRNVVINLLSNAVKYSPAQSEISINSFVKEKDVVIQVKDNGIGIPEEDQKHLFELFFRAKNATNTQGTGLGLSIVKRYLNMMEGDLQFTSKNNSGSTFTVSLPMEKKV